ncbi:MAG: trigger factor [Candidatus Fimousia sp.]|uniref:trigger factor n=1 Tax=Anaerostipes sp. 992a TaxID=1261637 RepID=UPI0009510050|nr:trigger factor [Anaerostipes sp. 992a]MDD5968319.1 trigger factor [Anaerostipes sp.]OLR66088.1 trigger factor [Anaerostipes sp. 992a]
MSLQVEKLEHNMAKLTIEVDAEEFKKATTEAYKKQKKNFNIPGFRKGKVPQAFIEKMYGPEVFYEEAANIIIPKAYAEEMKDCDLEIVSRPEVDIEQIEKGKPFIFTAEVALKPEVTLGEYKGLEVEVTVEEVTDEEVSAELVKQQEENAREITVEDRAIENGDIALIDYSGSVDGEKFEGGTAENQTLVIGSGSFIDNFEEQLIGKNIGEEVEVHVTFPEEYHAPELAGKPAVFEVKINGIKVKELPVIDDEFASEVSEFDTLDEYKADIRAKLVEQKEKAAQTEKENKVVDKAVENASMDIPEAMIEEQTNQMAQEFAQNLSYQGLQLEQYFQFTGMTQEKFMEDLKPQAKKRIESRLLLEAVVAAENIEATDDELNAEIAKMAEMYQMEAEKLQGFMGDAEKEQMKKDIAVQKAVDLLVAEAK